MSKYPTRRRKRLGQVFLRDPLVVEKILQSAHLAPHETVLEIGPGQGALTAALLRRVQRLYAIEVDAAYVAMLRQRFANVPHCHLIHADARTYDYGLLPQPLVVVANLPYSMGIPILKQLLSFRRRLSRLIVMLQREVADRLLATPGSSAYGSLSVFCQYYTAISRCFDVSRHAFRPVPAVDSTVLQLLPYRVLPWPSEDETFLFRVVRCAFAHRRKTLRANLLAVPQWCLTRPQVDHVLATLGLSATARAQELRVEQFVQLAELLRGLLSSEATAGS